MRLLSRRHTIRVSCPGSRSVKRQTAFCWADITPSISLFAPSILQGDLNVSLPKGGQKTKGNPLGIVIVRGERIGHPYFPHGNVEFWDRLSRCNGVSVHDEYFTKILPTSKGIVQSLRITSLPLVSWAVTTLRTKEGGDVCWCCVMWCFTRGG